MEKFFIPKDRTSFVNWLLELSINNDWTIVIEYSNKDTYDYLLNHATITSLPTVLHKYHAECKLTAFSNVIVTDNFVNKLMLKSHGLSIYDKNKMLFLIADDFHEECFSCTVDFYNSYYKMLQELDLIDVNWEKKNSG
jgi:hypothetical protein